MILEISFASEAISVMAQSVKLPCPHCGADAAAFELEHAYRHPKLGTQRLFLRCGVCAEPVIAAYPDGAVANWAAGTAKVFPEEVKQLWVWPKVTDAAIPNAVPANIASLYAQAMAAFKRSHYDAAGPLFRRIMEVSEDDPQRRKGLPI
jgi:hypothetical protein